MDASIPVDRQRRSGNCGTHKEEHGFSDILNIGDCAAEVLHLAFQVVTPEAPAESNGIVGWSLKTEKVEKLQRTNKFEEDRKPKHGAIVRRRHHYFSGVYMTFRNRSDQAGRAMELVVDRAEIPKAHLVRY